MALVTIEGQVGGDRPRQKILRCVCRAGATLFDAWVEAPRMFPEGERAAIERRTMIKYDAH